MKNFLLDIVYWTWCLPQTLWGFILFHFIRICCYKTSKIIKYKSNIRVLIVEKLPIEATALGKYIIYACNKGFDENTDYGRELIKHEYGHVLQSFILGPLYLPLMDWPSVTWAIFHRGHNDYFEFITEKWANRLAHVDESKL